MDNKFIIMSEIYDYFLKVFFFLLLASIYCHIINIITSKLGWSLRVFLGCFMVGYSVIFMFLIFWLGARKQNIMSSN